MARDATISQEQVNAAADALRAVGTKPTARTVRETLGTGSMATVLRLLQNWQGSQARPAESSVVLPPGLQRALVDFIGMEVSGAKLELQTDLVAAQQENSDLITESERQTTTIELQAEALEAAQSEKAQLAGRLAQVESELARAIDDATSERHAAEHARTELAKAQLRLEALPRIEAEADRLRAELVNESAGKVAAEKLAAVAGAKLDAMTDRAMKAEARIEQSEKQTQQAAQELNSARVQVQTQQTALDTAAREINEARKQTKDAHIEAKKAGEEAAELRGRLNATEPAPAKKPAKAKPASPE